MIKSVSVNTDGYVVVFYDKAPHRYYRFENVPKSVKAFTAKHPELTEVVWMEAFTKNDWECVSK